MSAQKGGIGENSRWNNYFDVAGINNSNNRPLLGETIGKPAIGFNHGMGDQSRRNDLINEVKYSWGLLEYLVNEIIGDNVADSSNTMKTVHECDKFIIIMAGYKKLKHIEEKMNGNYSGITKASLEQDLSYSTAPVKKRVTSLLQKYPLINDTSDKPKDMVLLLYETVDRVVQDYFDNLINHAQLIIYYFLYDLINTGETPLWINNNSKVLLFIELMDRFISNGKGHLTQIKIIGANVMGLLSVLHGLAPEILDGTMSLKDLGKKESGHQYWAFFNYPNSGNM